MNLIGHVESKGHTPDGIWAVADKWFEAYGLASDFRHLVNTAQISTFCGGLGNFLDEIRRPESIKLLNAWKLASPAAASLSQLAAVANESPGIPAEFSAYSDTRSARSHLGTSLKQCYLLALFITRYPEGDKNNAWLANLRLWLLVHAYQRSLNDSVLLDQNHRRVADTLRICCEGISRGIVSPWFQVFQGVRTSSNDWAALNSQIRGGANVLRENKTFPDGAKNLLQAIAAITTDDVLPIDDTPSPSIWAIPPSHKTSAEANRQVFLDEEEAVDLPPASFLPGDDESGDLIKIETPENISLSQGQQLERSVLLYSSEDQQYLPWSWSRPNPHEAARLISWLQQEITSDNEAARLTRALAWVSVVLGRSFRRTLSLGIGNDCTDEWRLHPEGYFHRRPPTRYSGWHPQTEAERRWVSPSLSHLELAPPPEIAETLIEAIKKLPASTRLQDLWATTGSQATPEQMCAGHLAEISSRLTPAMLAGMLPQQSYLIQRSPNFARLISSSPGSGLPGACGYGYWDSKETYEAFNTVAGTAPLALPEEVAHARALGSNLCPIEALLLGSLENAARTVNHLRELDDPIQFHNAFVAFTVVMLLAATGGRPIRDPFESLRFFDFEERFVYVEDKVFDGIHQGRLVPLPEAVSQFLQDRYLPHLSVLASGLMTNAPSLAGEVHLLTNNPSGHLPLFFFLGEDAKGLQWRSVSESEIAGLGLFDWPLPLNLFRHRLSRDLRIRGVDPEIIDAILGHAEAGCLTHSDYGLRVWEEDMTLVRPFINAAFDALCMPAVKSWDSQPLIIVGQEYCTLRRERFGIEARSWKRRERVRKTISDAKQLVREFLDGRKIEELSPDETDALSKLLLLNHSGLPHPNGHLRYRYLVRLIERTWRLRNKRVALRRRYFRPDEATPFTDAAPRSNTTFCALKALLADIERSQGRRPGQLMSISFGVLHLCLETRVANSTILSDVLNGRNFRLVSLNQRPFLEYAVGLTRQQANAAVSRFPLTWHTANYLHAALTARVRGKIEDQDTETLNSTHEGRGSAVIPAALAPLTQKVANHMGLTAATSMDQLIDAICRIVDQCNARQFPGVMAAYLGGRLKCSALGWHDWTRLVTGKQFEFVQGEDKPPHISEFSTGAVCPKKAVRGTVLELQKNAKELFRQINSLLLNNPQANSRTSTRRQQVAKDCAEAIRSKEGQTASAITLIAWWVHSKIFTGRTRERQALTSIARYLTALAPGFQEIAYDVDLFDMSDDDMTILYCNVMESRRVEDKAYVAKQLISFHRYARSEFGIADPDWAELPEFQAATPAAPCVIAEHEYQEALRQLFHDSGTLMHLRFARCLALLCGYRFALRPGESWGLLRRDWIHTDNEIIVLVRDNRHRTIKTRAGRRQVPLLFPLSPLEKQIVEQWQLELESQFGIDDRGPLFFDEKNPSQPIDREQLLRPINQVLKRVTGNPDVSLHDARHSAACNTALLLNEKALPGWQSFFENDGRVDIERELLGTRGPTRRKSWALARYVGHSHPSTTFGNYIHFLDGWLEQRLELNPGPRPLKPPAHLVDLDALPVRESTQSLAAPDLSEACTPAQVLRYARLLSRGLDPERAAAAQGVSQPIAKDVWHLLMTLSQRGKFSRTAMGEGPQSNRRPLEFIQRIRDNAWKRLLDVASEINAATTSALSNIAVDELCVMLSSRWQFVVWQPHQLAAAREIADQLATHDGHRYYRMLATIGCSKDLKEAAQIYGFELESIDVATGRGSQVQLGTVDLQGGIYRVDQRCALIFLENKFAPVRNAMELFLMAIALWAAP